MNSSICQKNVLKRTKCQYLPSSMCIGYGPGRFQWILPYQRQLLDIQQSGFGGRNLFRFDVMSIFRPVRSLAVSSQPCLPETINCSVSSCNLFHEYQMTNNIINVDTSLRHANYSASFVSGRLLRFHIPKFLSNICHLLMCSCQLPC